MTGGRLNFGFNIATEAKTFVFPLKINGITVDFNYWMKMTVTYESNGKKSFSNAYFNGTLIKTWNGTGKLLRFQDSSTLLVGKYVRAYVSIKY